MFLDVTQVARKSKDVRKFGKRPDRDVEIATEFPWTPFRRTFSDVRCDTESCTPRLRSQTIKLFSGERPGQRIGEQDEFVGRMPGVQAFVWLHASSMRARIQPWVKT